MKSSALAVGVVAIVIGCGGCTTFAQVKSADVTPGVRVDAALSRATPPGDAAAWFWSFDCAEDCDHAISSSSLGVSYGKVDVPAGVGYEIGGGVFTAFVQGVGLEHEGLIQQWGAMVVGRTRRESYGVPTRGRTIFVVLGVSARFSPFGSNE